MGMLPSRRAGPTYAHRPTLTGRTHLSTSTRRTEDSSPPMAALDAGYPSCNPVEQRSADKNADAFTIFLGSNFLNHSIYGVIAFESALELKSAYVALTVELSFSWPELPIKHVLRPCGHSWLQLKESIPLQGAHQ